MQTLIRQPDFFLEDSPMKKLTFLFPLILVAVGCTQGAAPTDPSGITSRSAEWDAALNAKDIDGIVALYTDDARMMAPNMTMSTGSDGVRAVGCRLSPWP